MDIVKGYPDTALALLLDVYDNDSIKNVEKETNRKFGAIDVVVNNAGYDYRCATEAGEVEAVQT